MKTNGLRTRINIEEGAKRAASQPELNGAKRAMIIATRIRKKKGKNTCLATGNR